MHCLMRPTLPWQGLRSLVGLVAILTWLVLAPAAAAAENAPPILPTASDFLADAKLQRLRHQPVLILYTRDDCEWCERLRREVLGPLQNDPQAGVLIRELDIDRDTPLIDWHGQPTTHREFARSQRVRFTPVVALFGPGGEPLGEPIVGVPNRDFYSGVLDKAIAEATRQLAQEARP